MSEYVMPVIAGLDSDDVEVFRASGYEFHNVSKLDKKTQTWHFQRLDGDRVVINFEGKLYAPIPVTREAQEECWADYSTKIGGKTVKGIEAVVARFSLHNFESFVSSVKGGLKEGEVADVDTLQERLLEWRPNQKNERKQSKPVVLSKKKAEALYEEDPDAFWAYVKAEGGKVTE